MMQRIKNAAALIGAAYMLNCGSTVIVEMANDEGEHSTSSSGSPSVGSGMMPGAGGMGGAVAWAQTITFDVVRLQCDPSFPAAAGAVLLPSTGWNTELWPMVRALRVVPGGGGLVDAVPGATEVYSDASTHHYRYDTGEHYLDCAGASELIVALPVVAD